MVPGVESSRSAPVQPWLRDRWDWVLTLPGVECFPVELDERVIVTSASGIACRF